MSLFKFEWSHVSHIKVHDRQDALVMQNDALKPTYIADGKYNPRSRSGVINFAGNERDLLLISFVSLGNMSRTVYFRRPRNRMLVKMELAGRFRLQKLTVRPVLPSLASWSATSNWKTSSRVGLHMYRPASA